MNDHVVLFIRTTLIHFKITTIKTTIEQQYQILNIIHNVRLIRQGIIGQYTYKVGDCRKYGSVCHWCKCICNSIFPLDVLCRRVGKRRKKTQQTKDTIEILKEALKKRIFNENKDNTTILGSYKGNWRIIYFQKNTISSYQ